MHEQAEVTVKPLDDNRPSSPGPGRRRTSRLVQNTDSQSQRTVGYAEGKVRKASRGVGSTRSGSVSFAPGLDGREDVGNRRTCFVTVESLEPCDGAAWLNHVHTWPRDVVPGVVEAKLLCQRTLVVDQNREAELQFLGQSLGVRQRIHTQSHDFRAALGELRKVFLQLNELLAAVGSPVTAIEHKHRGFLAQTP